MLSQLRSHLAEAQDAMYPCQVLQCIIKEHQVHGLLLDVVLLKQLLHHWLDGLISAKVLVEAWFTHLQS